jgi:hypothetical protein
VRGETKRCTLLMSAILFERYHSFPFVPVRIMCSTLSRSLSLLPELSLAHSHSSSHLIPLYTTNSYESLLLSISQSAQVDGVVLM